MASIRFPTVKPNTTTETSSPRSLPKGVEHLSVLNTIAAKASKSLNVSSLLELALDQMLALTRMEAGAVFLLGDDPGYLQLMAQRNLPSGLREMMSNHGLPASGESLPGLAVERCQLMIAEDSKDDSREMAGLRDYGVRTNVCIPLAEQGRSLGVLGLISRERMKFSDEDLRVFTAVGEQLGIALERTRLYEHQVQQTRRAQVVGGLMRTAVSSSDLLEALDGIADQLGRLVPFDELSVLRNQDTNLLDIRSHQASTQHGDELSSAFEKGQSLIRQDLSTEASSEVEKDFVNRGLLSLMMVPLISRGQTIGAIQFLSRHPGTYAEPELVVATGIADYLAVVVEHTLLHDELQDRAAILESQKAAQLLTGSLAEELAALIQHLERSATLIRPDGRAIEALKSASQLAIHSLEEANQATSQLQRTVLRGRTLVEAIADEIFEARTLGLDASLAVDGENGESISPTIELTAWKVVQEAIANARAHSNATSLKVTLVYHADSLHLDVSDDGQGFDADSIEIDKSLSHGLASIQERARLSGGSVSVSSTPGMGTNVLLELPFQPSDLSKIERDVDFIPDTIRDGTNQIIRVLVAEKHEMLREGMRQTIEMAEGMTVVGGAANGNEVLELVSSLDPDLILLDVSLKGDEGLSILRSLRSQAVETPVILLSSDARDEQVFEGLKAGAQGYLTKEVGSKDLIKAIRIVGAGGSLFQPLLAKRLLEKIQAKSSNELTPREFQVLELLATGLRNKEIAAELKLGMGTVKFHIANVLQKLGAQSRTEAIRIASNRGLVRL